MQKFVNCDILLPKNVTSKWYHIYKTAVQKVFYPKGGPDKKYIDLLVGGTYLHRPVRSNYSDKETKNMKDILSKNVERKHKF